MKNLIFMFYAGLAALLAAPQILVKKVREDAAVIEKRKDKAQKKRERKQRRNLKWTI